MHFGTLFKINKNKSFTKIGQDAIRVHALTFVKLSGLSWFFSGVNLEENYLNTLIYKNITLRIIAFLERLFL